MTDDELRLRALEMAEKHTITEEIPPVGGTFYRPYLPRHYHTRAATAEEIIKIAESYFKFLKNAEQ